MCIFMVYINPLNAVPSKQLTIQYGSLFTIFHYSMSDLSLYSCSVRVITNQSLVDMVGMHNS
jgi:hypothetical protein